MRLRDMKTILLQHASRLQDISKCGRMEKPEVLRFTQPQGIRRLMALFFMVLSAV